MKKQLSTRFLFLAVPAASSLLLALLGACSSTTVVTPAPSNDAQAADEEPTVEIAEAGGNADTDGGACSLGDIKSGVKKCDDCLLKSCCVVINNCYGDPACEKMNNCLTSCRTELGLGDAGADCARECAKKDAKAAEKLLDMLDCQSGRCGTECKG